MLKLPNFTKLNGKAQFTTVHFNFSETYSQKTDKTHKTHETPTSNPRPARFGSHERNRTNHGSSECQQRMSEISEKKALKNEIGHE